MPKPYILGIASYKGGVGKTTVAVNLAISLKLLNYKVLLIGMDVANPNLCFHLGLEDANIGFQDVIKKKADILKAIAIHNPTGLSILPEALSESEFISTKSQFDEFKSKLAKLNFDFIIIDTSPGFHQPYEFDHWDEGIIVSTPDMPSVSAAMRTEKEFRSHKIKSSLVMNKVKNKSYEIHLNEIEETWTERIYAVLPDSENVRSSLSEQIPVIIKHKRDPFSYALFDMANKYSGRSQAKPLNYTYHIGIIRRIREFLHI